VRGVLLSTLLPSEASPTITSVPTLETPPHSPGTRCHTSGTNVTDFLQESVRVTNIKNATCKKDNGMCDSTCRQDREKPPIQTTK
jgi:hypothetical protein